MHPEVDKYIEQAGKWQAELRMLRNIALACALAEEIKWGCPCYTYQHKNIVLIHTFKAYCALLFFKGALLADPHHVLIQQTPNVQAARQMRFTGTADIQQQESTIKQYIYEAIEIEKAGLRVPLKKTEAYPVPEEFQQKLDNHAGLRKAFQSLTPGRQRAYLFYFAQAKQPKTRLKRIEACIPKILKGEGLYD
ncbi:MAG: YdeI/OmpD-associated family protein [Thermoflavifilum sp.]|nr:YdeI/OmpD-associated family protein [Thermoflavifilum sp.]